MRKSLANTIATILGLGFLLVGLLGFIAPTMLGLHLSATHNLVHIITGAAALYFGLAGTVAAARLFCIVLGVVYALLGVVGFIAGSPGSPTGGVPGPHSPNHWPVISGMFEVGTMDHIVHLLLGAVFLVGGLLSKGDLDRAVDRR